jgi:hypothetical protein
MIYFHAFFIYPAIPYMVVRVSGVKPALSNIHKLLEAVEKL